MILYISMRTLQVYGNTRIYIQPITMSRKTLKFNVLNYVEMAHYRLLTKGMHLNTCAFKMKPLILKPTIRIEYI